MLPLRVLARCVRRWLTAAPPFAQVLIIGAQTFEVSVHEVSGRLCQRRMVRTDDGD